MLDDPLFDLPCIHHGPQIETRRSLEHLHESRVPKLLSSLIICTVLAVIAVIPILLSRRLNRAQVQSDDYMILMALVKKAPSLSEMGYATVELKRLAQSAIGFGSNDKNNIR